MSKIAEVTERIGIFIKRIIFSGRKIICPNCYTKFLPKEILFMCQNTDCTNFDLPFSPSKGNRFMVPVEGRCPGDVTNPGGSTRLCGEVSKVRACPHCKSKLPLDAGLVKSIIIAIVGGPGSSKSHYLVELFHRLQQIKNDVGIIPQIIIGKETSDFSEAYDVVHPRDGSTPRILPATQEPVRYHFVMDYKKTRLILTFYDNPGENWEPAKMSARAEERSKYIAYADGIILLVDLMQLENCRSLAKSMGKTLPNKRTWSQAELVDTMYQEARKLIDTKTIYKPIAVCMTKVDEMAMDFGDDRKLYEEISARSLQLKPYDGRAQADLSGKLRKRLDRWSPGLGAIIESRFSKAGYFAVAPTGCSPARNGELKNFNPMRVEDPFVWILDHLNILGEDTMDDE
ncbi:MAG: GTPase domain-containing protein [bacterium]|nr:GTPase domain-containing protein [bacterium]